MHGDNDSSIQCLMDNPAAVEGLKAPIKLSGKLCEIKIGIEHVPKSIGCRPGTSGDRKTRVEGELSLLNQTPRRGEAALCGEF